MRGVRAVNTSERRGGWMGTWEGGSRRTSSSVMRLLAAITTAIALSPFASTVITAAPEGAARKAIMSIGRAADVVSSQLAQRRKSP